MKTLSIFPNFHISAVESKEVYTVVAVFPQSKFDFKCLDIVVQLGNELIFLHHSFSFWLFKSANTQEMPIWSSILHQSVLQNCCISWAWKISSHSTNLEIISKHTPDVKLLHYYTQLLFASPPSTRNAYFNTTVTDGSTILYPWML